MFSCRTKDEILVCLKNCLGRVSSGTALLLHRSTHDRTFENSAEGDMTKLSLLLDQEIRFAMLGSSSMLYYC